jgi:hypothetical protein
MTRWFDVFDYDGMTSEFAIVGEFSRLRDARSELTPLTQKLKTAELAANSGWFTMSSKGKEQPGYDRVNKHNRVLARDSFKIGDGGYNSVYGFLEVIGVPEDVTVDESLFNQEDCRYEVKRFFEEYRLHGLYPDPGKA